VIKSHKAGCPEVNRVDILYITSRMTVRSSIKHVDSARCRKYRVQDVPACLILFNCERLLHSLIHSFLNSADILQ